MHVHYTYSNGSFDRHHYIIIARTHTLLDIEIGENDKFTANFEKIFKKDDWKEKGMAKRWWSSMRSDMVMMLLAFDDAQDSSINIFLEPNISEWVDLISLLEKTLNQIGS